MLVAVRAKPLENMMWSIRIVVFILLAWGGIAAVYGQKTSRAFWLGFIVTGWGYMAFEHFIGAPGRLPLRIRLSDPEREEIDKAAGGKSSTWARQVLLRAARKANKK